MCHALVDSDHVVMLGQLNTLYQGMHPHPDLAHVEIEVLWELRS